MTTTTRTFEKIDDIFKCKLLLEDGTEFTIPLREDGYIYATGLCKAAGKKIYHWNRLKETQSLKTKLDKKLNENADIHIGASVKSLEIYKGGNDKYSQGTWIHPDLGLNLAQWCSTNFAAQVSKWLRELIFTGNVELGKEKSNEEITNAFQKLLKETVEAYEKKLEESNKKVEESNKKAEAAENLAKAYDANHKHMEKKYREIHLNHQAYLRRKELYKLKTGSCVYIIDMKQTYGDEEFRYKIGQTSDITNRVSGFRTSNPFCKVIMVLYTEKNIDLEKMLKIKYEKQLLPNNSEFVTGVSKETLIENLLKFADILSLEYTIESEEELHKFNRHIIHEKDVVEVNEDEITDDGMKRCGGFRHKTEEERLQPLTNFFKHGSHKDGRARLCKECYLVGVYGDNRKKKKVVTIPEYDTTTHKWCNRCESVQEYKNFQLDKSSKDGHYPNCKSCKAEQKRIYLEKKKKEKEKEEQKEEGKEEQKETIPIEVIKEDKERLEEIQSKNPLERYMKTELMQLMRSKGIKVTFKMTKSAMIEKLSS